LSPSVILKDKDVIKIEEKCVLRATGITKDFPGTRALEDVDFDLLEGEVHALVGENGAGKSTLMNILMGIYQANGGRISIQGRTVQVKNPGDALRCGVGLVPQELNLIPELSVAENIFMGNEIKNGAGVIDWKRMNTEADKLLKKLHIRDIQPEDMTKGLSAAFQQLISIARILASGSKIIILDEPTASLTNRETDNLFSIMRELKKEGCSFIFITHHLDEVLNISDRVTILRDGRLVHECATKDITIEKMIYYMANQKVAMMEHLKRDIPDEIMLKVNSYTRKNEFRDISFAVKKREIFGIAGLVGAGRTELINAIYGLTKKDSGTLELDGRPVEIKAPTDAMKLGIGYVTEERRKLGIFAELPVDINMMMPSLRKFYKHRMIHYGKLDESAESYVKRLSIKTTSLDTLIKYLSGGNQQKVIIARWLEKQSNLLILDEPTRGIDVRSKGEIYQLIRRMADEGKTIIIISSETDELLAVCDRIMVMHEGNCKGFIEDPERYDREEVLKMALR